MVYNWPLRLQQWLAPCHCLLCLAKDPSGLNLCQACRVDLPWLTLACPRCSLPLHYPGQLCGTCQRHPPSFDTSIALFHYATPIDRLILELKFAAGLHHARLFAALLGTRLAKETVPDCIIPVPLHPSRQRERGFNQAIEIARPLSKQLGCPLDIESCIRIRPTPPQSLLSGSQRRSNLRGAFTLTRPLQARHVAVLDDVMTTGSTLNAVAKLLRQAGAERIDVWLCARTHRNK